MRHIATSLFFIFFFSINSHAQWTDSINESWQKTKDYSQKGWDKSKQYSQKGWDKTKNAWYSSSEFFSESEAGRQKSRADIEDERFREIWGPVFNQLNEGLEVVDEIKTAPDSALFGDDKKSLKNDLNKILDKTIVLLEDKSINDYRNKIDELNQLISDARENISHYREAKISAPRTHMVKTTQDDFAQKITDEQDNIEQYQASIEQIKVHFRERLNDIGVQLTQAQVNILLARVDADDIIQMSVTYDVLKRITTQLMQLTQDSGEEIKQAKKYYGMHVVLLELVNYMQQKYIDLVDTLYIPKINQIIDNTLTTQDNAKRHIREDNNKQRRAAYRNNINALKLTLKTAKLYKKNLKEQQKKVISAQQIVKKDLQLSQNTYDTVEISADLLSVLKTSKDSFDALMSLQVPQIVPFENLQIQNKYQELSQLLKQ